MRLTRKKAKELSIKKWKWLVKNIGEGTEDFLDKFPEFEKYSGGCPICQLYNKNLCLSESPIKQVSPCYNEYGLYDIYSATDITEIKKLAAREILKIIENWKV